MYLQDTLKEVETLKETIKFQEEENSSATKQLNNVTKECEEQVLYTIGNTSWRCIMYIKYKHHREVIPTRWTYG